MEEKSEIIENLAELLKDKLSHRTNSESVWVERFWISTYFHKTPWKLRNFQNFMPLIGTLINQGCYRFQSYTIVNEH